MLVIRLIACTFLFITPSLLAKPFPAERIISLAPHATSEYSDYPPQALELERVANHQTINIEKILTLKPDLIIAWPAGNPPRELAKLRQLGFTIYDSQTKTLDEIADNIEALSHYSANRQKDGTRLSATFTGFTHAIREQSADPLFLSTQ